MDGSLLVSITMTGKGILISDRNADNAYLLPPNHLIGSHLSLHPGMPKYARIIIIHDEISFVADATEEEYWARQI